MITLLSSSELVNNQTTSTSIIVWILPFSTESKIRRAVKPASPSIVSACGRAPSRRAAPQRAAAADRCSPVEPRRLG